MVEQLRDQGAEAHAFVADLSVKNEIERLVESVVSQLGRIDVVVNNAGVSRDAGADTETADGWSSVLAINLSAPFLLISNAIDALKLTEGCIVNVGSSLGILAAPNATAYCAAKGGLHHMTRQIALDLAPYGVRVNCVAPGFVASEMYEKGHPPERRKRIAALHPLNRVGTVDEVARAVGFLASDSASFITGACLAVDGGLTLQFGL